MPNFFWPPGKYDHTFSCKETLINTVSSLLRPFFGSIGDRINEVLLELTLIGQFCLQSDHCHFQINEALPPNHARGIRLLVWAFQMMV